MDVDPNHKNKNFAIFSNSLSALQLFGIMRNYKPILKIKRKFIQFCQSNPYSIKFYWVSSYIGISEMFGNENANKPDLLLSLIRYQTSDFPRLIFTLWIENQSSLSQFFFLQIKADI